MERSRKESYGYCNRCRSLDAGKRPAMVVELKHNQSADTAIKQIKEKRYQGALAGFGERILLVGVNYDAEGEDKKKHTCVIEEWGDSEE